MRLAVVSHKVCWPSPNSPSGYATDGGFSFQMRALSELFDETRLLVPIQTNARSRGEIPLAGNNLSVSGFTVPSGSHLGRKLMLPFWLARNILAMLREIKRADAVHTPIPGDIGTIGLLLAMILHKLLFVRHCGNWFVQRTVAEHFWRWLLERIASKRTVVLATGGGGGGPPSVRNPSVRWIFSTSLRESELRECAWVRTSYASNGPKLIICCRQEREKGTGAVIESLPLLEDEYPNISLHVVGDGSALESFRRIAQDNNVAHRVRFYGNVNHTEVRNLLRGADLFCFPTTSSEGFPKAVLEALACGLPVVSTRVSVLGELIGAGSGVLIDDATADGVAWGIRVCLGDSERYHAMSSTAVGTASRFSLEQWRDTIASLLTTGWGPLRSLNA